MERKKVRAMNESFAIFTEMTQFDVESAEEWKTHLCMKKELLKRVMSNHRFPRHHLFCKNSKLYDFVIFLDENFVIWYCKNNVCYPIIGSHIITHFENYTFRSSNSNFFKLKKNVFFLKKIKINSLVIRRKRTDNTKFDHKI
jgi:hypothetical protein